MITSKIKESPKSILLLGPRQVGKSTLIKQLKCDLRIDLADEKTFFDFNQDVDRFRQIIEESTAKTVFVDEIQRIPRLLNTIQSIVDDKKIKFYITGSSARKLKRGKANLLPGRVFTYYLGPLAACELNYDLNEKKALELGSLPEVYLLSNRKHCEKLLESYSAIYLKEEIQAEALTRNLDGFVRFLSVAAEKVGKSLDFSKVAKEAKIERRNCSKYFEILEDTMIGYRIEVYDSTGADIVKRPRFYFFDNGVLNGLVNNFSATRDWRGILLENLFLSQLKAAAFAKDLKIRISYFRTRGGYEVDFVVELGNEIIAVEVKLGQVSPKDATKLRRFQDYEPSCKRLFILCFEKHPRSIHKVKVGNINYVLKSIGL